MQIFIMQKQICISSNNSCVNSGPDLKSFSRSCNQGNYSREEGKTKHRELKEEQCCDTDSLLQEKQPVLCF